MNYWERCDFFDEKGKLIDEHKVILLPPTSTRVQFYQIDIHNKTIGFRDYEKLNMLRVRIGNTKLRYISNIDPKTDEVFVQPEWRAEGDEKTIGKFNLKTKHYQQIEYKLEQKEQLKIVQNDDFVLLIKQFTGVEILHKKRNFESEIIKKDES